MKRLILVATGLALLSSTGMAEDREAGQWIARAGVGGVFPKDDNLKFPLGVIDADEAYGITLTGVYMLTDAIGIELLASSPWTHDLDFQGVGRIGDTKQLPPTLSLQWHTPAIGQLQPYFGLGVNWTIFYDEEAEGALAGSDLDLDDSVGVALQAAVDWHLNEKWLLNADLRWINIESDVSLDGVELGTARIDPVVFSLNVGYKF